MSVETDIEAIVHRDLADPHRLLGAHPHNGGVVVRAFRPAAAKVTRAPRGRRAGRADPAPPGRRCSRARSPGATLPLRYELEVEYGPGESYTMRDPYAFAPTLGEIDLYLAGEGRHEELYEKLGAHVAEIDGATGVAFAVWAPSARSVSVVGDFNSWDGRLHPMRSLGASGIWELFIPGVPEGSRYKFELRGQDGDILLRADPFAFEAEMPPKTASVVNRTRYEWTDEGWMALRQQGDRAARADVDLRGPPRLLAAEPAGGQPLADLPRAGRRAGRLRHRPGLHPRRAACRSWPTRSAARGATR